MTLRIFLYTIRLTYVLRDETHHQHIWEKNPEHVPELAASFPRMNLGGIRFRVVVFNPGMVPVSVRVHLRLREISVLVEGVVLQVMNLYQ